MLVVEDDDDIRDALAEILREQGYPVAVFPNGQPALAWLKRTPGTARIVLLDLMMPVMSGFEFLEIKEADAVLASVPVVVLTASDGCKEVLLHHRVVACLRKPCDLGKLLDLVEATARCTDVGPRCLRLRVFFTAAEDSRRRSSGVAVDPPWK